jgi:hypothetical protein
MLLRATVQVMSNAKTDWEALGRVFTGLARQPIAEQGRECRAAPVEGPSEADDLVCYDGEKIPKWLAADLIQERAAILEFEAGYSRPEAEAIARRGLSKRMER